jgi:REP element-mobilizing transposase RayT
MSTAGPDSPRRSRRAAPRLKNHDYRLPGWYFVTFCTWRRARLFDPRRTRHAGVFTDIVYREWLRMGERRSHIVELDERIVMPDHFHGLVWLKPTPEAWFHEAPAHTAGPVRNSLGSVIGVFKAVCARRINEVRGTPGAAVWQRSFYDSIVRTPGGLAAVRRYIRNNPKKAGLSGW